MKQRIALHLGFWLAYLLIHSYLEMAFTGSSFRALPWWQQTAIAGSTELLLLPPKIAAVYLLLYRIIPSYLSEKRYVALAVETLLIIIVGSLLLMASIYFLLFPLVYQEPPEAQSVSVARFFWGVLDMSSVLGLAATFKLVRLRLASVEREKQLIQEKLQSELQFLRAQTNPHFLFNTLNNIYALARKKSDQTADVVLRLSKLLRFMLYECTSSEIPIGNELKVIRDYIELEKIRYNQRLEVEYQEQVDDVYQAIAPLLLLPLVENAFKHGASETRFATQVFINIKLHDGALDFYIKNSKDTDSCYEEDGIGLRNVKRQLELLYADRYRFRAEDRRDHFVTALHLKL